MLVELDPAVISPGLAQDGQGANPDPGQVRSLTSKNNFINFCLTQDTALTNGQQLVDGSCNPTPMGRIISLDVAPSAKFVFPKNTDSSLQANQAFTIQLKVSNMALGNFVNAQRCALAREIQRLLTYCLSATTTLLPSKSMAKATSSGTPMS